MKTRTKLLCTSLLLIHLGCTRGTKESSPLPTSPEIPNVTTKFTAQGYLSCSIDAGSRSATISNSGGTDRYVSFAAWGDLNSWPTLNPHTQFLLDKLDAQLVPANKEVTLLLGDVLDCNVQFDCSGNPYTPAHADEYTSLLKHANAAGAACIPEVFHPRHPHDLCPNIEGIQTKVPDGFYIDEETGQCVKHQIDPPCDGPCPNPTPTPTPEPTPTPSPSPTPEPSPSPTPTPTPEPTPSPSPTPTPPPGLCYYRVSCGDIAPSKKPETGHCTDHDQQTMCEDRGGAWLDFETGALHNHCRFVVPGISDNNFQLNPGQSDPSCLNKNSN